MGNYACGLGSLLERPPKPPKRRPRDSLAKKNGKDTGYESIHTYDTVSDFPVYAVVNKKKKEEGVHYADVRVFTKAPKCTSEQVKELQKQNETAYATLAFPAPSVKYDHKNGTLV